MRTFRYKDYLSQWHLKVPNQKVKNLMKKALTLVAIILLIFIVGTVMSETNGKEEKPYVAVTSFTLYEIANKLVGKNIEVKKLVPFGTEMHSYMPSPKIMALISKSELFIFNGIGMESWIKKEYANQIDMSKYVTLISPDEDHHEHHHNENGLDPHYWLDIDNMILMTRTLSEKMSAKFPQYKEEIQNNASAYIKELQDLDAEYEKALKSCKRKEIVVNHNAFGYLAHRYKFHSHSVTGLSVDEQASAKKMKEITDLVKNEGIKIIFFESFVSPKVSETISQETGARVLSLQPLANVNIDEAQKGYISLMKDNLKKLSLAMECK